MVPLEAVGSSTRRTARASRSRRRGPRAAPASRAGGRVVFVGMMMAGAEIVVLAHDEGVVTLYAHLDAWAAPPTVAAGDEVAAGQKIGTVGLTGLTLGLHLHWAAWKNGTLIDP